MLVAVRVDLHLVSASLLYISKREWEEEENLYLAERAPIKKLILIEVRHATICQYTSQTPRGFMGIAMYT